MGRSAVWRIATVVAAAFWLAACATTGAKYSAHPPREGGAGQGSPGYKIGSPYQVGGVWYVPKEQPDYNEVGVASWYGDAFQLKPTANGETFDKDSVSAAHKTLPLPSLVEVTNLDNGRKLVVRVNDRGPFVDGRIIDLSHEAARELGYDRQGLARVRVRYLGPAPLYNEDTRRFARYVAPHNAPAAATTPPPKPKHEPDLVFTSAPLPKRPSFQIAQSELAPLPAGSPSQPITATKVFAPYRVQVGAFSTPASAQRVVAQVASTGAAFVEPIARNGTTLYRVVLDGLADQDAAEALRQRIADIGFADARVIRPF